MPQMCRLLHCMAPWVVMLEHVTVGRQACELETQNCPMQAPTLPLHHKLNKHLLCIILKSKALFSIPTCICSSIARGSLTVYACVTVDSGQYTPRGRLFKPRGLHLDMIQCACLRHFCRTFQRTTRVGPSIARFDLFGRVLSTSCFPA
jgi:hypothetical protein